MKLRLGPIFLRDTWSKDEAMVLGERLRQMSVMLGDLINPPHAYAYADNVSQTLTITATATPVDVSGLTASYEEGFTFSDTSTFTSRVTGRFLVSYQLSFTAAANLDIEAAIAQNGTWMTSASSHVYTVGTHDTLIGGNAIVELQEFDTLTLQVQNLTDNTDITLKHANWSIVRVSI